VAQLRPWLLYIANAVAIAGWIKLSVILTVRWMVSGPDEPCPVAVFGVFRKFIFPANIIVITHGFSVFSDRAKA
jgi:hypothetical protein